jgi:hypothetical protein
VLARAYGLAILGDQPYKSVGIILRIVACLATGYDVLSGKWTIFRLRDKMFILQHFVMIKQTRRVATVGTTTVEIG